LGLLAIAAKRGLAHEQPDDEAVVEVRQLVHAWDCFTERKNVKRDGEARGARGGARGVRRGGPAGRDAGREAGREARKPRPDRVV
jgi:hypothetical protein